MKKGMVNDKSSKVVWRGSNIHNTAFNNQYGVYCRSSGSQKGSGKGIYQERGAMSGASVQRMSTGEPVPNATFDRGGVSPTRALARRHTGWMLASGW